MTDTIASVAYWVILAAGVVISFTLTPRYWMKGVPHVDPDRPPRAWVWGGALWKGFVRALPIAGPQIVLFFGPALPVELELVVPGSSAWEWQGRLWILAMGIVLISELGIVLFNRPKFLIPPRFRNQPGAIEEWLDGWRAKKARR